MGASGLLLSCGGSGDESRLAAGVAEPAGALGAPGDPGSSSSQLQAHQPEWSERRAQLIANKAAAAEDKHYGNSMSNKGD
jgi:hypothetical protein